MEKLDNLSRRRFLHLSAVAAGGAVLGACGPGEQGNKQGNTGGAGKQGKGSATRPIEAASQLKEAPMLKQMVDAGDIPPLEERLPEKPYVVPHEWVTPGNYGGNLLMSMTTTEDAAIKEYMYGHSILRFLNDGLDIGPGLAESWESNDDASEWTLHFREGLKWSDGEPWTTQDIMYWWEDLVQNEEHPEVPPDDVRSGKDTTAKLTAPDDTTLVLTFDAPAPITPEKLAAWVNRGVGPRWMEPRHYLEQFHPRYNKDIKSKNWYEEHDLKANWATNPEAPTMTGWRLKSYKEGRNLVMERNPFYWCVSKEGAQLPYIDGITFNAVQDPEVQKLQFTEGRVDYVHGGHTPLTLGDIQGLKQAEPRTGVRVWFWDSGSGTGSIMFLSQDYYEEKMRNLIREPKFRRALSHAFNRDEARKAIYYNTGENTTGTLSPKGQSFQINEEAQQRYEEWRDAYVEYDPELAKSLLDEIGVKDQDGDGVREMPDGSRLEVRLDFPADTSQEHIQKNNFLKRDWEAVGVKTQINPVPPEGFGDQWANGRLMSTTAWEVGDNSPLVYAGWVVPVETGHWAPLHGQAFTLQTGDPQKLEDQADEDPWERQPPWLLADEGSPIDRLWKLYAQARVETDLMKRMRLLWDVFKIHIEEGPYFMGVVANYPRIVLVREGLNNVPKRENLALGGFVNPWILPSPAVYDPETYYWNNPEEHA
jgi:peptide/nickel transport system substrate-binding protein